MDMMFNSSANVYNGKKTIVNYICKDESCRRIKFNNSTNDKKMIKPKFSPNVSLYQVTGLVETTAQRRGNSHRQNTLSNVYERLIDKCSKKLEKPCSKTYMGYEQQKGTV